MSEMNRQTRRAFIGGSVAVMAGAGAAAIVLPDLVSGQNAPLGSVGEEIERQLAAAIARLKSGQAEGAWQAASMLRVLASTVDDNGFKTALRRADKQRLLSASPNHGEMVRLAVKLGVNPTTLPPHSNDRGGKELALNRLLKEGLGKSIREAAVHLDTIAEKLVTLEIRYGGPQAIAIALRQPIPESQTGECTIDCKNIEQAIENATRQSDVACAGAGFGPAALAACTAAGITIVVLIAAYASCLAIVSACNAYYRR